jgi:hypothetical protein
VGEKTDAAGAAELAEKITAAYSTVDLAGFGALLADDVRWGDDGYPRACRNREDVMRTFGEFASSGVRADVVEVHTGPRGVACRLHVNWPERSDRGRGVDFFHVFMLRQGLVGEIRRYDDADSARAAIGSDD